MSVTLVESAVFMGKNNLNNRHSITNSKDLSHLKQMFDTSARVVSEQNEISVLETTGWENHSSSRTSNRTMHGKKDWDGSNHPRFTETLAESTVSQWNSSGIFSRIQYVAAQRRSQTFTVEIR